MNDWSTKSDNNKRNNNTTNNYASSRKSMNSIISLAIIVLARTSSIESDQRRMLQPILRNWQWEMCDVVAFACAMCRIAHQADRYYWNGWTANAQSLNASSKADESVSAESYALNWFHLCRIDYWASRTQMCGNTCRFYLPFHIKWTMLALVIHTHNAHKQRLFSTALGVWVQCKQMECWIAKINGTLIWSRFWREPLNSGPMSHARTLIHIISRLMRNERTIEISFIPS